MYIYIYFLFPYYKKYYLILVKWGNEGTIQLEVHITFWMFNDLYNRCFYHLIRNPKKNMKQISWEFVVQFLSTNVPPVNSGTPQQQMEVNHLFGWREDRTKLEKALKQWRKSERILRNFLWQPAPCCMAWCISKTKGASGFRYLFREDVYSQNPQRYTLSCTWKNGVHYWKRRMEKGFHTRKTCSVSKILPHQQLIFQGVTKVIVQLFVCLVGVDISVKVFSTLAAPEEPSIFRYAEEWLSFKPKIVRMQWFWYRSWGLQNINTYIIWTSFYMFYLFF